MLYERTVKQLQFALAILVLIVALGTAGYVLVEGWEILDALYMTLITITTVGFAEVHPLSGMGRVLTMSLIVSGVGTIAYAGGRGAQLLIENQLLRKRRMSKRVEKMSHHYIVCGFGRMGQQVCEELAEAGAPFVVIEKEPERVEEITELGYAFVAGDATQDEVLERAGIHRAKGMVATLSTEAENVFATLSARELNPDIFIVARAVEEGTEAKLYRAGANRVVKPYEIGGARIAQVLLRPGVVDFIDLVARQKGIDLKLEEIQVHPGAPIIGKTLAESPIRKDLNIIIVAIFREDGKFIYNPYSNTKILEGDRLIAIGNQAALEELNKLCLVSPTQNQ